MSALNGLFRPEEYFKPASVKEAIELLMKSGGKGRLVAGGTDLMVERDPQIELLIDVTGLDLGYIKTTQEGIRIGAAATFADISISAFLSRAPYDVLAEAARQTGTPRSEIWRPSGETCVLQCLLRTAPRPFWLWMRCWI